MRCSVTVRRFGTTIVLEPDLPHAGSGAVSVEPSVWSGLVAAVDALRRRAALATRAEAALALVRAGMRLEDTVEPSLRAPRLNQRRFDLARGLATDPTGIVLRGFFARLSNGSAVAFMSTLREVAARGVACYIVASDSAEADLAMAAVRRVFGAGLSLRFA